uniref:Uncharacterized protein n=1 Tax=Setaria viridis TaxID=4556 RepID=A0A4U6SZY0_SETVI|nr:hypothetical protein SEVIR_9G321000v2 [Setaria viridis]
MEPTPVPLPAAQEQRSSGKRPLRDAPGSASGSEAKRTCHPRAGGVTAPWDFVPSLAPKKALRVSSTSAGRTATPLAASGGVAGETVDPTMEVAPAAATGGVVPQQGTGHGLTPVLPSASSVDLAGQGIALGALRPGCGSGGGEDAHHGGCDEGSDDGGGGDIRPGSRDKDSGGGGGGGACSGSHDGSGDAYLGGRDEGHGGDGNTRSGSRDGDGGGSGRVGTRVGVEDGRGDLDEGGGACAGTVDEASGIQGGGACLDRGIGDSGVRSVMSGLYPCLV